MKTILTIIFSISYCLIALSLPPIPTFSSHPDPNPSISEDPFGNRIAVWTENNMIMSSYLPLHGHWSMPHVISNPMASASSPRIEIDASGNATLFWVEDNSIKAAFRPVAGDWGPSAMKAVDASSHPLQFEANGRPVIVQGQKGGDFSTPADRKRPSSQNVRTTSSLTDPYSGIYPGGGSRMSKSLYKSGGPKALANAIDAPAAGVLRGAQIGFTAGTAAPSDGLIVNAEVGIGVSTFVGANALEIGGSNAAMSLISSGGTGLLRLTSTGSTNYIQSGLLLGSGSVAPLLFTGVLASPEWARFESGGSLKLSFTLKQAGATKTVDIGETLSRFNNIFVGTSTVGTSRLADSQLSCTSCSHVMKRGTGTLVILGETADYIPCWCVNPACREIGNVRMDTIQHLPAEQLPLVRPPPKIEFLGLKINIHSGNSRQIQVMFRYVDAVLDEKDRVVKEPVGNSTYLSDVEYKQFLSMTESERQSYLRQLGLREWNALEELRLMEEDTAHLQEQLDSMTSHWKGNNMLE